MRALYVLCTLTGVRSWVQSSLYTGQHPEQDRQSRIRPFLHPTLRFRCLGVGYGLQSDMIPFLACFFLGFPSDFER